MFRKKEDKINIDDLADAVVKRITDTENILGYLDGSESPRLDAGINLNTIIVPGVYQAENTSDHPGAPVDVDHMFVLFVAKCHNYNAQFLLELNHLTFYFRSGFAVTGPSYTGWRRWVKVTSSPIDTQ